MRFNFNNSNNTNGDDEDDNDIGDGRMGNNTKHQPSGLAPCLGMRGQVSCTQEGDGPHRPPVEILHVF